MGIEDVAGVYHAQIAAPSPLPAQTQAGVLRFATRQNDLELLAGLAGRVDLDPALRGLLAERTEPLIKVAILSRPDTALSEIQAALVDETRSGVLAGLLNSPRASLDDLFMVTLEPAVKATLAATPTRVLAEAAIMNDRIGLDVRSAAARVLRSFESLPLAVVDAMQQVVEATRADRADAARAGAFGGALALRADALIVDGLDAVTRTDLLHEVLDDAKVSPSYALAVVDVLLDEVDDLQPEVLDVLREAARAHASSQSQRTLQLLRRIDDYSAETNAARRTRVAEVLSQVRNATSPEVLDSIAVHACEHGDPLVAAALLGNHSWHPVDMILERLTAIVPAAELALLIKARRDDRVTRAAYLTQIVEMVHLDQWRSCVDTAAVQRAVATGLRQQWDATGAGNGEALHAFTSSGVAAAALVELPWDFFCSAASAYEVGADAEWITRALSHAQAGLVSAPAWETFEEIGKNFNGSLRELAAIAAGV